MMLTFSRSLSRSLLLTASLFMGNLAFAQGPVPPGSPLPRILPPATPEVGPGARALPTPAPIGPGSTDRFNIQTVAVEGATAYPDTSFVALKAGLVGPEVPRAKIEEVRLAILKLYRDDGYVLTAVSYDPPAQGTLRFVVTEGRIADVKLDGDIGPAGTTVLRFLHHLTQQQPIDIATLERWLLLAQEVPGVTLRTTLRPSTDQPGALTLVAQVERKQFSGLLAADNAAFPRTGPAEALLVLNANSFTQFGEQIQVSLYHTSGNTQNFGQASAEFFVGSSGLRVRLYGGAGPTDPSGDLRAIGYHGFTTVFGAAATYPVLRRREQALNATVSLDAVDESTQTNTGPGGSALVSGKDSVRALRIGADYARHDLLLGGDREAVNTVNVRFSQGLTGFGASSGRSATAARLGENPGFSKINVELSRTQTLFQPWQGASVALIGLLSGQWSPDILPTVEKFYLGGLRLTPGYYSGEVTGDKALNATAELQFNTSYDFALLGRHWSSAAQLFGFCAWGETWENQKLDPNRRLASAGGGVRLYLNPYVELDALGVSRFVRRTSGEGPNVAALSRNAAYWRVLIHF